MTKLNLRLPPDVRAALNVAAEADDRSLNGEATALLRAELTRRGILPAAKNEAAAPDAEAMS